MRLGAVVAKAMCGVTNQGAYWEGHPPNQFAQDEARTIRPVSAGRAQLTLMADANYLSAHA